VEILTRVYVDLFFVLSQKKEGGKKRKKVQDPYYKDRESSLCFLMTENKRKGAIVKKENKSENR